MGAHLHFEVCLLECAGQRTAATNVVNSGEEFVDEKVFLRQTVSSNPRAHSPNLRAVLDFEIFKYRDHYHFLIN